MPDKIYLPVSSTGPCRETHNACDCVLEQLAALRKVAEAAIVLSKNGDIWSVQPHDLMKLRDTIAALRAAEGKGKP